jgi:predicted Zn-dependent protease
VYRARGDEVAAEKVLRDAIGVTPTAAEAHHALGLSFVRQQRPREGLAELAAAVRLGPRVARYSYVYAVALHDTGSMSQATRVLTESLASHPFDRDTLSALATYAADAGRAKEAREYAARLRALDGK